MRTLIALTAAMMLAASCSALTKPTTLTSQSWSTTHSSRWYSLNTGVSDLLIEGTSNNVIARQISTGTIRKTWSNIDGDDYRILDGSGTSSLNRLKIYSFDTIASRSVLNVKTLGSSMTAPAFTNTNWTLPTIGTTSSWNAMTSLDGVVYFYGDNRYLIGVSASTGMLVTNMTVGTSGWYFTSTAKSTAYKYSNGAKFLSFKMYNSGYRHIVVDLVANRVVTSCSASDITSSSSSYSDTYAVFAPSYTSTLNGVMYPLIFAWGSDSSTNTYASMINATTGTVSFSGGSFTGSCSGQSQWSGGIPNLRMEGSRTSQRAGMPFTYTNDGMTAIYTSFDTTSDDGRLIWLNYQTGSTIRNIRVDSSISWSNQDQCGGNEMVGPFLDGTSNLIFSFEMYLYQYATSGTFSWSYNYNSVFSNSDVDDAGCAPWRYITVQAHPLATAKNIFVTNSGGGEMAAMAIGTSGGSNSNGDNGNNANDGGSSSSGSSSYYYSPWYQVTLQNGKTGSSAKSDIQTALYNKYFLLSSSLSGWYYSGSYITFRIYYGSVKTTSERNAASGLLAATTNSTLRTELGFASCSQTIDPNVGGVIAAAFGTLFIVLILIGVAIVICVVAIIVCCCCCTAKAVADASAPPQQTVVMAQQPMMGQPGYAVQPGQIQQNV